MNRIDPFDPQKQLNPIEKNDKSNFRIKKIANIALITLASVSAALAAASALGLILGVTFTVVAATSICTIILTSSLIALTVLGILKAWQLITPRLPNVLRIPANYLQSSVCGIASAIALAAIWPINYAKNNIKPEDVDPSKPLIIGIHGFMGSSNNWIYHFGRLKEAGYKNLASINLGNWFLSIDDYIEKVRELVLNYKNNAPLPPDGKLKIQFLCHSMGGLVARHYNQKYSKEDGVIIDDIITLGTPLDGTRVAYLAFGMSGAGRQMHPKSDFVRGLQDEAMRDETTRYFHIGSKCDYVIRPLVSALEGRGKKTETAMLDATGHISYLFSDKTADLVISYLKNKEEVKEISV